MRVSGIAQEMGIKIHDNPLRTVQYRTLNKTSDMIPKNEYCNFVASNLYTYSNSKSIFRYFLQTQYTLPKDMVSHSN